MTHLYSKLRYYIKHNTVLRIYPNEGLYPHSPKKISKNVSISEVSDEDEVGFLVLTPNGMGDDGKGTGSWNVSRTDGPLGPPCDTDRAR